MRADIAELVFPVFRMGIQVIDALRSGSNAYGFAECQKKLLALLQTAVPDTLRAEMLGDVRSAEQSISGTRTNVYLGIRYALACWLDEIFIEYSPWKDQWSDSSMEVTLFGIRLRSPKFWEQAQRAQSRPTRDALEAFYLCVMLGFRGEMFGKPNELNAWRDAVETQLTQGDDRTYSPPPGLKLNPNVPELKGASVMQRRFLLLTVLALMFIPLLVVLFVRN